MSISVCGIVKERDEKYHGRGFGPTRMLVRAETEVRQEVFVNASGFCTRCCQERWPYALVVVLAGIVAYLTWLVLEFTDSDKTVQIVGSISAFIAVGATLLHYVITCLKRHCRH